ncbi:MAG: myo-inositol 2-dehydrogenase / D-chiro-inositol 1-dehydrogenase [Chloroflexi bacterium]|jgi:predicted dehydrogenase|nr:MAG: myo-inositol 2-dehydrogenase / D-chiro-inositol 1-dehydrogenase [Chloroflexota bacterium]
MASEKLRVGVIGVGFGATVQIPGFQSEGWDVVAVCSRRQERASKTAADFSIPHVYTDYQQMVERDDLDAISIVTPNSLHLPMTKAALQAGKHVLCDKPMAMDQSEAKEMLDIALETGLTAMIAHEFRFAPQRAYMKELLNEGFIGDFRLAALELLQGPRTVQDTKPVGWASDPTQGGGFMVALGSHFIDALRHLLGEITGVSGTLAILDPDRIDDSGALVRSEADDAFSFTASFAQGGQATMTGTREAPFGEGAKFKIYGSDGALSAPHPWFNPPPDGKVYGARLGDEDLRELPMPGKFLPFEDDRDHRLPSFRLLLREFARGIREGSSPSPNFYDGYRCQKVLDAIKESSSTGRWVDIAEE